MTARAALDDVEIPEAKAREDALIDLGIRAASNDICHHPIRQGQNVGEGKLSNVALVVVTCHRSSRAT